MGWTITIFQELPGCPAESRIPNPRGLPFALLGPGLIHLAAGTAAVAESDVVREIRMFSILPPPPRRAAPPDTVLNDKARGQNGESRVSLSIVLGLLPSHRS